ncbi:Tse2 family ADP-ribosyltransferase toxin [Microbulbifer agarilyticus]
MFPKEFYILPEELFRLGNSSSPKLGNIRPKDIDTMDVNGIKVIIANGKGISVFDLEGIKKSPMTGWVWRFSSNTRPPIGLKMVQDKPHHYCISPVQNMPLDKYKGLLEEMALSATRVFKKEGQVV